MKTPAPPKGHNRMAAMSDTEYIMIMNPDIVVGPRTLLNLLAPSRESRGARWP